MATDELLTFEELRAYLKIHKMTLWRLTQRGEIPAMKVGRSWRYSKAQIQGWLQTQSNARMRQAQVVEKAGSPIAIGSG
ncbi:MAG: helix-turn-helix domain-containing protein [Candidatus Omnitrophica bacterium]|nr:helix-turn-helix domain-containing protein [Candidatus Omnitrophota bacterium]